MKTRIYPWHWPARLAISLLIVAIRLYQVTLGPLLSSLRPGLPLRAQLQPLHDRCAAGIRALQRPGQGNRPRVALPPLASGGLRPALKSG